MVTPVETAEAPFDVIESIRQHIAKLNPLTPKRSLICLGDYPTKILLSENLAQKIGDAQTIFIQKTSKDSPVTDPHDIVGIDPDVATHFWFDTMSYLTKNDAYSSRLKSRIEGLHENIILAPLWEGLGSALLPILVSQFNASNANSVALAVLPSYAQPSDAHFNAFASIGMCASNSAAVVLLDRDCVEDYVGVDRKGSRIKGNIILDYLLGIMLDKETFTQELNELSRSFGVKLYTMVVVTGASLKIYGSFKNMLSASSLNPFLTFDLASASVLYILVRAPLTLKEKLTRGKIELAAAKWSKNMPNIKSIYVTEPIYVDETSDRVDVVVVAGGFDLTELTSFFRKKSAEVKSETVKKGLIKEEEWEAIVKSLDANQ